MKESLCFRLCHPEHSGAPRSFPLRQEGGSQGSALPPPPMEAPPGGSSRFGQERVLYPRHPPPFPWCPVPTTSFDLPAALPTPDPRIPTLSDCVYHRDRVHSVPTVSMRPFQCSVVAQPMSKLLSLSHLFPPEVGRIFNIFFCNRFAVINRLGFFSNLLV